MKSSSEVVRYIDTFISSALERPSMYGSSPIALEEVLRRLDAIRDFILCEGPETAQVRTSYGRHLSEMGYGVGSFCMQLRKPSSELSETDVEVFNKLAEFWKEYLRSQKRPQ